MSDNGTNEPKKPESTLGATIKSTVETITRPIDKLTDAITRPANAIDKIADAASNPFNVRAGMLGTFVFLMKGALLAFAALMLLRFTFVDLLPLYTHESKEWRVEQDKMRAEKMKLEELKVQEREKIRALEMEKFKLELEFKKQQAEREKKAALERKQQEEKQAAEFDAQEQEKRRVATLKKWNEEISKANELYAEQAKWAQIGKDVLKLIRVIPNSGNDTAVTLHNRSNYIPNIIADITLYECTPVFLSTPSCRFIGKQTKTFFAIPANSTKRFALGDVLHGMGYQYMSYVAINEPARFGGYKVIITPVEAKVPEKGIYSLCDYPFSVNYADVKTGC